MRLTSKRALLRSNNYLAMPSPACLSFPVNAKPLPWPPEAGVPPPCGDIPGGVPSPGLLMGHPPSSCSPSLHLAPGHAFNDTQRPRLKPPTKRCSSKVYQGMKHGALMAFFMSRARRKGRWPARRSCLVGLVGLWKGRAESLRSDLADLGCFMGLPRRIRIQRTGRPSISP